MDFGRRLTFGSDYLRSDLRSCSYELLAAVHVLEFNRARLCLLVADDAHERDADRIGVFELLGELIRFGIDNDADAALPKIGGELERFSDRIFVPDRDHHVSG